MPEKIDVNKNKLNELLFNMPKGYGEGRMMSSTDAQRITEMISKTFFLVNFNELPFISINDETLTALEAPSYASTAELDIHDSSDRWWDNVLAAIANYKAVIEIQELRVERDKQDKQDKEFAFKLFKTLDPANLHYTSWNHLSRLEQQRWLNVARKAREELSETA